MKTTTWMILALVLAGSVQAADMKTCPFAGHNTYLTDSHGRQRLKLALDAGLRALEVDVNYGRLRRRPVVTHKPVVAGLDEPALEPYLEPIWAAWARDDGAERVLCIDLKTDSPELAAALHRIFQKHAAVLSHLAADGSYVRGAVVVMLTGKVATARAYEEYARAHGGYLAFGWRGEPKLWPKDAASMVPSEPPGFVRFLNLDVSALASSASGGGVSAERAAQLTAAAHRLGYRVRVWTVNARQKDGAVDMTAWNALLSARVDFIATDDYQLAADTWRALP